MNILIHQEYTIDGALFSTVAALTAYNFTEF